MSLGQVACLISALSYIWLLHSLLLILFLLLLVLGLILLFWKSSFFLILVLLEVSLILTILGLLYFGSGPWFVLPLLTLGACESSLGLSLSVWYSRSSSVSEFSV